MKGEGSFGQIKASAKLRSVAWDQIHNLIWLACYFVSLYIIIGKTPECTETKSPA
ncbi:hypothetical protein M404DRAFT_36882 [Pisolithus tinctorius Marx 270]|uniref:Uncharacterized protein n=1 Tax=Pisolithus tinctorius Marx 270 TaxID=870435 RepID=A0A0C3MUI4_PISTI|nr:hypothetical protein M404DRAFT_36882 [Pisolithus tinctorius Marx 270]